MRSLTRALVLFVGVAACHPKPGARASDASTDARLTSRVDGGEAAAPKVEAAPPVADDSLPPFTSDELTTRAKHLLEAIAKDDADLATDIVFPRDAYLTVKDVPDPGKNWDQKVLAAFKAQVHTLHHHTKGVERAVFTGFELGQPATEALPKKHDLKRMLWRARRSRLGFSIDGKPSHFDIVEVTGWRGSWYVTKLR
jgi:hypothetical protein